MSGNYTIVLTDDANDVPNSNVTVTGTLNFYQPACQTP